MNDESEKVLEAISAAAAARGGAMPPGGPQSAGSSANGAAPDSSGTRAQAEALPIDWSTEPKPVSANGVQVMHSANQFAMIYTDMVGFPGRNSVDGRAGHERATVVSSLRLNPDTYFQALCVMASNWNKYVEQHVPAQMRQPRFKLLDSGELQLYGIPRRTDD